MIFNKHTTSNILSAFKDNILNALNMFPTIYNIVWWSQNLKSNQRVYTNHTFYEKQRFFVKMLPKNPKHVNTIQFHNYTLQRKNGLMQRAEEVKLPLPSLGQLCSF